MIGIKYPIFQGGMAWIADANLAASVSNGGGLGIISAMNADAEYLRGQIVRARELTDEPFGVNIMLMSPFADEVAQIAAEEKVKVITTGAGNPTKYMKLWKDAGITVVPVVASCAMAKMVERAGADALADGRGVAASFMLGAVGVQLGTRFLVARECGVHQNYKDAVLAAGDISTVTTGRRFGGNTCRQIKNTFSRNFIKEEYSPEATAESVAMLGAGALRRAAVDGDAKNGSLLCGQIAGLVNKEQSAAEIIEEIFSQAEELLRGTKFAD